MSNSLVDKKPKFRARKLEYTKPLKVFRWNELEDDEDLGSPTRAIGMIATGVDKEEEEEHHLQAALTTAQVTSKDQQYVIPTPDTQELIADYDTLYPATFKLPKGAYLRPSVLGVISSGDARSTPRYNADAEDTEWLNSQPSISMLEFERIVDWLEEQAGRLSDAIVTAEDAVDAMDWLGPGSPAAGVLPYLIDFWRAKRRSRPAHQHALIPQLKFEDVGKIGADPYVCFRRRELKIQRKTRRSDAQCLDKIRKLRFELETISAALSVCMKRDRWRMEALQIEHNVHMGYVRLDEMKRVAAGGHIKFPALPPFRTAVAPPQLSAMAAGSMSSRRRQELAKKRSAIVSQSAVQAQVQARSHYKISLPAAAFKSLKYSRPYYPYDMLKYLQRDLDGLLAETGNDYEDKLPFAWREAYDSDPDLLYYRRTVDDFPGVPGGEGESVMRVRRGRGGRILLDRQESPNQVFLTHPPDQDPWIERDLLTKRMNLLTLRDCAQLTTTTVGNYNHHYIQSTMQLTRPYTFFGWLAATSAIQVPGGGNGPKKRNSPNGNSPKKARTTAPAGSGGGSPVGEQDTVGEQLRGDITISSSQPMVTVSSPQPTPPASTSALLSTPQHPSTSGGLMIKQPSPSAVLGSNITVKVKKQPSPQGTPTAATTTANHTSSPSRTPSNHHPTKRFTPTGLSPGE